MTTDEIDKAVHKMIVDNGAYPSPLTYGEHSPASLSVVLWSTDTTVSHRTYLRGLVYTGIPRKSACCAGKFPKSVCTSVNECVCHGIPDSRRLAEGDIVNIDVTVYLNVSLAWPFQLTSRALGIPSLSYLNASCCLRSGMRSRARIEVRVVAAQGYHGDTSRMYAVGKVSDEAQRLCDVTLEALTAAISQCGPNVPVRRIGEVLLLHHPVQVGLIVDCAPKRMEKSTLHRDTLFSESHIF